MHLEYVWIIYKANNKKAKEEALKCVALLNRKGKEALAFESESATNSFKELSNNKIPNLAIVLGGDGTVLGAARYLAIHKVPILSFNVGGSLGFLTHDHNLLKSKELWERLEGDHFAIQKRMMLEASLTIISEAQGIRFNKNFCALNDFYFRSDRDEISPTCSLKVEIDGEAVDTYKGDGLILSSPTGSTAYAMATGGPILHPGIEAMIVSAICPMSLSSRPIVIPSGSNVIIQPIGNPSRRVKLWQDGVSSAVLSTGDSCLIKKSFDYAQMLILEQSPSYYRTLTQKLHWAGSLIERSGFSG